MVKGGGEPVGSPASGLRFEVEASGPAPVMEAIAGLGRTEDVRFSPDGRRLAIACFQGGAIAIVDVEISRAGGALSVAHTGITRLAAAGLQEPHGVDWLDERTVIVADRSGWIGLVAVPDPRPGEAVDRSVDLLEFDGVFADLYGPGSVRVTSREATAAAVLVCNNWGNCVTRTHLERADRWTVSDSRIALRHLLDLPDGVAVSHDGSWVAVSNHNRQVVVLYPHEAGHVATEQPDGPTPVGVLRGAGYPHGLCFTRTGDRLVVADAGNPFVHVHQRGPHGWSVADYPSGSIQVLSWDEFRQGNARPDEGGPKGVDLDPAELLMATTCEAAPLRWFDWAAARTAAPRSPADLVPLEVGGLERETALKASLAQVELRLMETETRELEAQVLVSETLDRVAQVERQAQVQHDRAAAEIEALQRAADEARRNLAEIEATRSWRALAPIRRMYASVLGLRKPQADA